MSKLKRYKNKISNKIYFLKKWIKAQYRFFIYVKPNIPKSVRNTYSKKKRLIQKENLISKFYNYFDRYMPLNTTDVNNPSYKDRLYVNHYRLWTYLGDKFLSEKIKESHSFPEIKSLYFNQFNLTKKYGDYIPRCECYLCELYMDEYSDCACSCEELWKPFKFLKSYFSKPCIESYYGLFNNCLTYKQTALICYMIASLVVSHMELDFYKKHLLADTSEEKIDKAYANKQTGNFEPEPLFKDLFVRG